MLQVARDYSLNELRLPDAHVDGTGPTSGHEFSVSQVEHEALVRGFSRIKSNPYTDYSQFRFDIRAIVAEPSFPDGVKNMCQEIQESRAMNERLHFLIHNLPVDRDVPDFNTAANSDPLAAKYRVKQTFLGEAVQEMFSQLTGAPLLAYSTRNNGDFFQDVISEQKYKGTQTQKTDGELYPHNDRTAHDVRPDILNLLAMRPTGGNVIQTTYFDGRELLRNLDGSTVQALKKPIFFTPFDDFSKASNSSQQESTPHAILTFMDNNQGAPVFRFYSCRTQALHGATHDEAIGALLDLERKIIGLNKHRINLDQGDFLSIPNLRGLHAREVVSVVDPRAHSQRWLLKTYAFWNDESCVRYADRFDPETPGRVQD
jgi:L-asparagine oxygenase